MKWGYSPSAALKAPHQAVRWIVQWLAGLLVPGAPTGFLLEGWPDAGGVIDDVQRRHAAVGAKFRNIDRIEGGLLPGGQLPVEAEPDGGQRRPGGGRALRHAA